MWELVQGVRGPPGGTDKDGKLSWWLGFTPSLYLQQKPSTSSATFTFVFTDKLFFTTCRHTKLVGV